MQGRYGSRGLALAVAAIFARTRNGSALLFLAFGSVVLPLKAITSHPVACAAACAIKSGMSRRDGRAMNVVRTTSARSSL